MNCNSIQITLISKFLHKRMLHWDNSTHFHQSVENFLEFHNGADWGIDIIESFHLCRYFSSSPPQLSPEGREEDADAIIGVIRAAKLFVHVAVMDFAPAFLYKRHEVIWVKLADFGNPSLKQYSRVSLREMSWKSRSYSISVLAEYNQRAYPRRHR